MINKAFLVLILLYAGTMISSIRLASIENTFAQLIQRLENDFGYCSQENLLIVSVSKQELYKIQNGKIQSTFPVSTARAGIGNKAGSYKTPLGIHKICAKIGENAPAGTIFRGRINTGQIAYIHTDKTDAEEDLILTRILRLDGLEPGLNKGRGIDSFERFIYIHATNSEGMIGEPVSKGCIRMKNADIIYLFNNVQTGTFAAILE